VQEFTAPLNTTYKIECWGASGGNHSSVYGGKGGYCFGMITLPYNSRFYVYVGQSGDETVEHTFNGGGKANLNKRAKSGGGATDVRLTEGNTWSDFNSLKSRIIIAAGGGGAIAHAGGCGGGNAGGLFGYDGFYTVSAPDHASLTLATGATQTSGGMKAGSSNYAATDGTFGIGGDSDEEWSSGGGSGYYGGGGGAAANCIVGSGSGGSSFISGYTGCDAISESSTEDNIIHTGQPNHYSGKVFTNPIMIDGGSVMPKPKGGTETGHSGNGYAIFSWISTSL